MSLVPSEIVPTDKTILGLLILFIVETNNNVIGRYVMLFQNTNPNFFSLQPLYDKRKFVL